MWTLQGTCRYRRGVCKGNWEPQSHLWALFWSITLTQVSAEYLPSWTCLPRTPRSKVVQTSCFILASLTLFLFLESPGRGAMLGVVAEWKNDNLMVLGNGVWLAAVYLQGDDIHTSNHGVFWSGDRQTNCLDATRELKVVSEGLSTKKNIWERCMQPTKSEVWVLWPLMEIVLQPLSREISPWGLNS